MIYKLTGTLVSKGRPSYMIKQKWPDWVIRMFTWKRTFTGEYKGVLRADYDMPVVGEFTISIHEGPPCAFTVSISIAGFPLWSQAFNVGSGKWHAKASYQGQSIDVDVEVVQ
jgi:hypothetical protein